MTLPRWTGPADTHKPVIPIVAVRSSKLSLHRLLGKLTNDGAVVAREHDGTTAHHLTPAGYRAIGIKPPRRPRASAGLPGPATAGKPGTKRSLILDLLAREEGGASLDELIAATGWLPHTTRAALSRLRSGGQALVKGARPDGRTAYRIVTDQPEPVKRARGTRRSLDRVEAVA